MTHKLDWVAEPFLRFDFSFWRWSVSETTESQTFPANGKVLVIGRGFRESDVQPSFQAWVVVKEHWRYTSTSELPAGVVGMLLSKELKPDTLKKLKELAQLRDLQFVEYVAGDRKLRQKLDEWGFQRVQVERVLPHKPEAPTVSSVAEKSSTAPSQAKPTPVVTVSSPARSTNSTVDNLMSVARRVLEAGKRPEFANLNKYHFCHAIGKENGHENMWWAYNHLRLAEDLSPEVQQILDQDSSSDPVFSLGQAMLLSKVKPPELQMRVCLEIKEKGLSAKKAEAFAEKIGVIFERRRTNKKKDPKLPVVRPTPQPKVTESVRPSIEKSPSSPEDRLLELLSETSNGVEEILTNPQRSAREFFRGRSLEDKKKILREVYSLIGYLQSLKDEIRSE